jgi:small subunit ribosomal protein S6
MSEMERQQRINEDVLRQLTVRVDEHEAEPSAMMRKVDRDRDRDDRRGGFDRGDRGFDRDRGERGGFDRDRGPRRERPAPREEGESTGGGAEEQGR